MRLTSYKAGVIYHCKDDNVSPGAWLARASTASRGEAERQALDRTQHLLSRTKRRSAGDHRAIPADQGFL